MKFFISPKKITATVLSLMWLSTSFAQKPEQAKLDQFLDRLSEKNKAMGSLYIAKNGTVLYNRSIGYSRIGATEKDPLTADTRYRIGSVTKMFTAALIFQLAEEGKLQLSDKLDRFFPKIPGADRITIEHLLAHRSGIRDMTENPDFRNRRFDPLSQEEMVAYLSKRQPDFEPGTKYAYSSSGYYLLGMIVEKLTGKPYADALKSRISSRIGLKDTYPGTGAIDSSKKESYSYRYGRGWEQQPQTHMSILFGSGALISTPADMARFIQALFDGKLVSAKSLARMKQDSLGMQPFTYNGKTGYGHTGGVDGFGTWLVYVPEEKLVVSYATNAKVYPVTKIMDGVFDIVSNKPFVIPTFDPVAISTEVLDSYSGTYSSTEVPLRFTITREDQTLFLQPPGQSPVPLEATAPDRFIIEAAGIVMVFDASKKQMRITRRNGPERILTKEN